jgi:hypothetical protein
MPVITGAVLVGAVVVGVDVTVADLTEMLNGARLACLRHVLAVITILEYVPTLLPLGTPESVPLESLKEAHKGLFWMEYRTYFE